MDDTYFKRTLRDIALYSKQLAVITSRAKDLGLGEEHVSVQQAVAKVDAAVREYLAVQKIAEELGYKSIRFALKALSQTKEQPAFDLTKLPETFQKLPNIWLSGKSPRGKKDGFAPLTVTQAERKYRVIIPLLIEAWQLAEGDEGIRDSITREYLTSSADEFERSLYRYINDLEEVTIEEELENWEVDPSIAEMMRSIQLVSNPSNYGIVNNDLGDND